MSPSELISTAVEYVSTSSTRRMGTTVLGLPDELLGIILTYLSFWQVVNSSQTCSRLRAVALAHSKLWQNLPPVRCQGVRKLRAIVPFLGRTGELGFDLDISFIKISELTYVCSVIGSHVAQFRKLHLDIEQPPKGTPLDTDAVARLQHMLSAPAPLLEDLCIAGDGEEAYLGTMQPDVLGRLAPKLQKLHLTVFSLDSLCPGLQAARSVIISVGALAPKENAAENKRLHALFPAIKAIELKGIDNQGSTSDSEVWARPLTRVPIIDRPLESLRMSWYPEGEFGEGEDVRAAAWLRESVKHVRNVVLESVQWEQVSEAVLSPLLEKARHLRIRGHDDSTGHPGLYIALWDADRRRRAIVSLPQAQALLGKFLRRADRLSLEQLWLSTDPDCLGVFNAVQCSLNELRHLRVLRLDIEWDSINPNGWFGTPGTLASLKPMNNIVSVQVCAPPPAYTYYGDKAAQKIDARFLLLLLMKLFPNAKSVAVSIPLIRLPHHQILFGYRGSVFRYLPMR